MGKTTSTTEAGILTNTESNLRIKTETKGFCLEGITNSEVEGVAALEMGNIIEA